MRRNGAFLIGSSLGGVTALAVLAQAPGVGVLAAALILLYGYLGYGIAAAVVDGIGARLWHRRRTGGMGDAVAVAVATVLAVHAVSALVRLRRPELAWLLPGCILSGAAAGWLARWVTGRVALLQTAATWRVANLAVVLGAAIVLAAKAAPEVVGAPSGGTPPNVLLISVDTLRRDRLGCYGYARARTPRIDALARESVVFDDATSPVPLTGPSHTTMLTGLYPIHHGALGNGSPIRAGVPTVPERLARAGYRTAAFVSGWTLSDAASGLAGRFEWYDEDFARWPLLPDAALQLPLLRLAADTGFVATGYKLDAVERLGATTTQRALAWLERRRNRPFFLLLHYFDAHGPHRAPPPYDRSCDPDYTGDRTVLEYFQSPEVRRRIIANPRQVEFIKRQYDGEISYVDAQVGQVLDALQRLGLSDHTLVIFTADHGESLTEHDFYFDHGEYLYETCIRVPLMMRFPDRRYGGTRQPGQARLVDLAPTILAIAGVPAMPGDGRSLLPLLDGSESPSERFSVGALYAGRGEDARVRYYVREGGYKLIWSFDRRADLSDQPALEELYDLRTDPGELRNLSATAPPVLEHLRQRMHAWMQQHSASAPGPGEGVREQLRQLGYE